MGDTTTVWARPARSDLENKERYIYSLPLNRLLMTRAFAAAARRVERPIASRIESALEASRLHFERTGRCYYLTPSIVEGNTSFEDLEDNDHFSDPRLLLPQGFNLRQLWEERCHALKLALCPLPSRGPQVYTNGGLLHQRQQLQQQASQITSAFALQASQQGMLHNGINGTLGEAAYKLPMSSDPAWTDNGNFGFDFANFESSSSDSNQSCSINPALLANGAGAGLVPGEDVNGTSVNAAATVTETSPAESCELDYDDWLITSQGESMEEDNNLDNE
jgi:hypothetical protein